MLRLLIDSNGLSQADLAAERGGQPVVSAVLARKRAINARWASALACRQRCSSEARHAQQEDTRHKCAAKPGAKKPSP